jgi:hypothetical protein
MDGTEVLCYFIGLLIVSVAVGSMTTPPVGFIVLGGGIMISIAVGAIVRHFTPNRG